MIRIYVLYNSTQYDLTPFCKTISISGDKGQVARKLEVTFHYSIWDKNHSKVQVGPGSKVWVLLDNKQIFYGIVWGRELKSNEEISFAAFDYLIYLQQSSVTYNFKNILVEEGIRKILKDLGMPIKSIVNTGITTSRIIQDQSAYDAIMELLTQATKVNGKQYILINDRKETSVIEKGKTVADFKIKSSIKGDMDNNVLSASYKDTMENMVNRVKIYDNDGNYIGEVGNSNLFDYFGMIQKNYTKEEGKNHITVARNMLHDLDRTVSVECLGNWNCRTGFAVNTEMFYVSTLSNATMHIDSDTHTWEVATNKYTMSLSLNFESTMDMKGD